MPAAFTPPSISPTSTKPGDMAALVAEAQYGAPYAYGKTGPYAVGFDCSGLLLYAYLLDAKSPKIDIGRDTGTQWTQTTTMTTIIDANADQINANAQGGIPPTYSESQLEIGDCLYYFQPGNNAGPHAHAKMYIGGGSTIEAPYTGQTVQYNPLDFVGTGSEPFAGVRRVTGGGSQIASAGAAAASTDTEVGQGNQPATGAQTPWWDQTSSVIPQLANAPDPRSNLPFSAYFQGQIVAGVAGSSGTFGFTINGNKRTAAQLVRGGIAEILQPSNNFRCYFMMNPQTISCDAGINLSQLSPFLQDPTNYAQSGGNIVTNQTITFRIYFNRMYDVWRGGTGQGPWSEGCRWDIRALERLMGVLDAQSGTGTEGQNGWGSYPPSLFPLQVVFGGKYTMQFQGVFSQLDYEFTIFDSNMIPVEAYADVSIMRVYLPQQSNSGIVSSLITSTGASGAQITGISATPTKTRSQAPNFMGPLPS